MVSLTAVRTAAIAGYATDLLALPDATHFVMVGAGYQAPYQVEAVLAVRPITHVAIWNRSFEGAQKLAETVRDRHHDVVVEVVTDIRRAVAAADVITLATGTREPLIDRPDLRPHCHINAMGASKPDYREVAGEVIAVAEVFADTVEGCLEEAGDLLIPIAQGLIRPQSVKPLWSATPTSRERLTVMKSVGSAVFDVTCAWATM